MSEQEFFELKKDLQEIKRALSKSESEYANTRDACAILGITNVRYVTQLYRRGILNRYHRAERWMYKKEELRKVAEMLDRREIILEPLQRKKAA